MDDSTPAGFWVRAGAFTIDWLIITCIQVPFVFAVHRFVAPEAARNAATLANLLVFGAYMAGAPVLLGATVGKLAAGLRVRTLDGEVPEPKRCAGRAAAQLFSLLVAGMGCVMAAFTERKRALHDLAAGTVVVYAGPVQRWRQVLMVLLSLAVPAAVAAIVIVLIAMNPRMKDLVRLSGEGATKGNLGSLRAATAIYYGDHDGVYPPDLAFYRPEEGKSFPATKVADHPGSSAVTLYDGSVCRPTGPSGGVIDGTRIKDAGGWGYVADRNSPCWGSVFVDCSHKDAKGKEWFAW